MKSKKASTSNWAIGVLGFLLIASMITGCRNYLNPVDPESEEYQGFESVDDPDELKTHSNSGEELVFLYPFILSEVRGADAYSIQIATSSSFAADSVIFQRDDFSSNTIEASPGLQVDTTYYWRGRAHKGSWGEYTGAASFSMDSDPWSGLSPADGDVILDIDPMSSFSWGAVDGAERYQVQIAESESELESVTAVDVTGTEYRPTEELTAVGPYWWRVRAVDPNGVVSSWSATMEVTLNSVEVGKSGPAGGIVFYDKGSYSDGWRYLEAAPSDINVSGDYTHVWGGFETLVGGTGTSIGTGEANTEAIVAAYGEREPYNNTGNYAARLSDQYEYGGYDDWFLPSRDELNEIYNNRGDIGGLASTDYWSSSETEGDPYDAWVQSFYNGKQFDGYDKDHGQRVRAVRAF